MPAANTYKRPMAGWWRRNPFYYGYMVRELSSVILVIYTLLLLCGVYRLAQGRASYEGWLATLRHPVSVWLHVAALAIILYHAWTWFKVMPKTMPFVRVGGKRVSDNAIIATGCIAAVVLSALLFAFVWGVTR